MVRLHRTHGGSAQGVEPAQGAARIYPYEVFRNAVCGSDGKSGAPAVTFNISPRAAYGSLLKSERPTKHKARPARDANPKHLAAVRQCPCLSCGRADQIEAAHVRMSTPGKPNPGVGMKPDDKFTLPLCAVCHRTGPTAQHEVGEVKFWAALGIDPLVVCARLYAVSPDVDAMRAVIAEARSTAVSTSHQR